MYTTSIATESNFFSDILNHPSLMECFFRGRVIPSDLEKKVKQALGEGKVPLMMSCVTGTTVMGAFDPIRPISEICKRYNIWLHIDVSPRLSAN